jgi:hypothetical protein
MHCTCTAKRDIGPLAVFCPYPTCPSRTTGAAVQIGFFSVAEGQLAVSFHPNNDGASPPQRRLFFCFVLRKDKGEWVQLSLKECDSAAILGGTLTLHFATIGQRTLPLADLLRAAHLGREVVELA